MGINRWRRCGTGRSTSRRTCRSHRAVAVGVRNGVGTKKPTATKITDGASFDRTAGGIRAARRSTTSLVLPERRIDRATNVDKSRSCSTVYEVDDMDPNPSPTKEITNTEGINAPQCLRHLEMFRASDSIECDEPRPSPNGDPELFEIRKERIRGPLVSATVLIVINGTATTSPVPRRVEWTSPSKKNDPSTIFHASVAGTKSHSQPNVPSLVPTPIGPPLPDER